VTIPGNTMDKRRSRLHVLTAGEELKLNKILMISILFMSIGTSAAYADQDQVDAIKLSDFMDRLAQMTDFEIHDVGCEKFEDGIAPLIQCYLEGFPYMIEEPLPEDIDTDVITCTDIGLVYDPDTDKCMTPENFEKSAIEKANRVQFFPDYPMSPKEQQIFILEAMPELTDEQFQRLQDLKRLDECANDILVMQTYRVFQVLRGLDGELIIDNSISNFKYSFDSAQLTIDAAIQECLGQEKIPKKVQYGNIWAAQSETISHRDMAKDVPVWSQERMLAEANWGVKQPKSIHDLVCDGNTSNLHKLDYGCDQGLDFEYVNNSAQDSEEITALLADVQNWKDGDMKQQLDKTTQQKLQEARQRILNQRTQ